MLGRCKTVSRPALGSGAQGGPGCRFWVSGFRSFRGLQFRVGGVLDPGGPYSAQLWVPSLEETLNLEPKP